MLISLIVPVFNLERYLDETCSSIVVARQALGEAAREVEIVFVDDGSTDRSGRMLDAFAASHGAIVVHKPNGGEGSARNAGIERATGDYLMFLDGDDLLLPNAFVEAVARARAFPEADIFSFRFERFEDGGTPPPPRDGEVRRLATDASIAAELVLRLGVFPGLYRRTAFAGFRFSALPLGADREYVLSCLARARAVVLSEAVVGGYRQRGDSMSHVCWTARKITSLNDHALHALQSLTASGRRLEPAGPGYLASLVVSEVPARLARLHGAEGSAELWRHWIETVRQLPTASLPSVVRMVRRAILFCGFSRMLSVAVARCCRALNLG